MDHRGHTLFVHCLTRIVINGISRWTGPEQFEDPSGQLMMLPSDLALVWDKGTARKTSPSTVGDNVPGVFYVARLVDLGGIGNAAA